MRTKEQKKKDKRYNFLCPTCKKEFTDCNYIKNRKFCSARCRKRIVPTKERIKRSKIAIEKGYGKWMIGRKRPPFSKTWKNNLSKAKIGKRTSKNTEFKSGDRHINWKGGPKVARKRRWQKVKKNPRLRLRQNVSVLMSMKLKRRLLNKNKKSTFNFLPYTVDELMQHLEKQFTEGMTWDNYGKWHIDHKIPDSSFKYSSVDDDEFKKCWDLKNLQPLWGIDNIKKGAKIIN